MKKEKKITALRPAISVSFTERSDDIRVAFMRLAQEKFGRSGAELLRDLIFSVVAIYDPQKLVDAGQRDKVEPSILIALLEDWKAGRK